MSYPPGDQRLKNDTLWQHAQLGTVVAGFVHGFFMVNQYAFSTYMPTSMNKAAFAAQLMLTSATLTHAFNLFQKSRRDGGLVLCDVDCRVARAIRFNAATCTFASVAAGAVYGEQALQFMTDPSNMFRSLAMLGLVGVIGLISSSVAYRAHRRICRNCS